RDRKARHRADRAGQMAVRPCPPLADRPAGQRPSDRRLSSHGSHEDGRRSAGGGDRFLRPGPRHGEPLRGGQLALSHFRVGQSDADERRAVAADGGPPRRRAAMTIRLAFFKLNVPDMDAALAFWREGFSFAVTQTFDEPEFLEHIMTVPGQEAGPSLLLVRYKDGRDVSPGPGHG